MNMFIFEQVACGKLSPEEGAEILLGLRKDRRFVPMLKTLKLLGQIDGGIAAVMATWGLADPFHASLALMIGGITGGVGIVLNAVSHFYGGGDVVNNEARKLEMTK